MRACLLTLVSAVALIAAGCGGQSDRSASIASQIGGGATCSATGFYITFRTDGHKESIYDCSTNSGEKCVTESGGLANDRTALARIVFANVLGGERPSCAAAAAGD